MRDYGKVAPQFWTGTTGKALKAAGPEAVIVAMYLMTSPHANMIGLYYLPMLYLAHETGLGMEGASKGLARAIEAGFCSYEEASEHVFVHAMARYQVAEQLAPTDNRCKGIERDLEKLPKGPLVKAFRDLYAVRFNLKTSPQPEAPSKPLASQEQEQEQEQEQIQAAAPRKRSATKTALPKNFTVSDRVRQWAAEKGHGQLDKHMDHFCMTASAKGYTYADWDSAFMKAVADNWAKLAAPQAASQAGGGRRAL